MNKAKCGCEYCTIDKCPFVIRDQCHVKKMWDQTEILTKIGQETFGIHMVNTGRISPN